MPSNHTKYRRILVTGGRGLVGSRLCNRLIEQGHSVTAFDNLSAYPDSTYRHLSLDTRCRFIEGDIRSSDMVSKAIRDIDTVIHAAAVADVAECTRDSALCTSTNIAGTTTIFDAAARGNVSRALFVSSASVYGNGPAAAGGGVQSFTETTALSPISEYGRSKMAGEAIAFAIGRASGMFTTAVRYFSVYGPPQIPKLGSHSWAVAIFAMRARCGLPLELNGGGTQVRDWTYIDDIVDGTLTALWCDEANGQAVNIGTGQARAVRDIAELVANRYPLANIEDAELPEGDPLGGCSNPAKSIELLGWRPSVPLEQGVARYIDWLEGAPEAIPSWLTSAPSVAGAAR